MRPRCRRSYSGRVVDADFSGYTRIHPRGRPTARIDRRRRGLRRGRRPSPAPITGSGRCATPPTPCSFSSPATRSCRHPIRSSWQRCSASSQLHPAPGRPGRPGLPHGVTSGVQRTSAHDRRVDRTARGHSRVDLGILRSNDLDDRRSRFTASETASAALIALRDRELSEDVTTAFARLQGGLRPLLRDREWKSTTPTHRPMKDRCPAPAQRGISAADRVARPIRRTAGSPLLTSRPAGWRSRAAVHRSGSPRPRPRPVTWQMGTKRHLACDRGDCGAALRGQAGTSPP